MLSLVYIVKICVGVYSTTKNSDLTFRCCTFGPLREWTLHRSSKSGFAVFRVLAAQPGPPASCKRVALVEFQKSCTVEKGSRHKVWYHVGFGDWHLRSVGFLMMMMMEKKNMIFIYIYIHAYVHTNTYNNRAACDLALGSSYNSDARHFRTLDSSLERWTFHINYTL